MTERQVPERWRGTPAETYWMNPEACARLVAEYGGQRAAAREIGVAIRTFSNWLSPERGRESSRKYRETNSEKILEGKRKYYETNSEKIRERNSKYRETNSEKILEGKRKYREDNPDKVREQGRESSRKYREANREKVRESGRCWYENLSGYEYNRQLLRSRRRNALRRMAKRNQRPEELRSNG